jgi:hypothetical protein
MKRASHFEHIIGKYKVVDYSKPNMPNSMLTDNPLEAMWEANRFHNREIENICGEREFYKDETGRYRLVKL